MADFKFEDDGSFEYAGWEYVRHEAGSEEVLLDGTFTIAELESLIYMVQNARPKKKAKQGEE